MLRRFFCLLFFVFLSSGVFAEGKSAPPDMVILEKGAKAICEKHILLLKARMILVRTSGDKFCIFDINGSLDTHSTFEVSIDADDVANIVFSSASEFLDTQFSIGEADETFEKIITRVMGSLVGFLEKQGKEPPKKQI